MPNGGKLTISTRNAAALPEGIRGNEAEGWVVLEVKSTYC